MNLNEHWDNIFENTNDEKLGWYEDDVNQTLKFFDFMDDFKDLTIFITGAGTSLLVDNFVGKTKELTLNDISKKALEKLELKHEKFKDNINFFHHDLSKEFPENLTKSDIWIDRAVLHFLVKENDILKYFENLKNCLNPNAFVLFAEFSIEGANSCASLPIKKYNSEELSKYLGEDFVLIKEENYTFINPFGGERPYIYALFRKVDNQ